MQVGDPLPLGAQFDGEGTNFALFSENADAVELCLYQADGRTLVARHFLPENTHGVWHGYLANIKPGCCYGYRVYGKYDPSSGHRFNHHKLLLDPYAKKFQGQFEWHESHYAFDRADKLQDMSFDSSDNAPWMPKAMVVEATTKYPPRKRSRVPWHQSVIYEAHVRGFTMLHPDVPESMRGKFLGMSQPQIIDYLKALGITSVELLPVCSFLDEAFLAERGLSNYWGYNSLSFFTPHQAYTAGNGIQEFRQMVDRFHDAGLEVILDVVYNHTCEGNQLGPTVSFRGIDNASYYSLLPSDKRFYINESGCGNTLNIRHPRVMQLIIDSLRYWVEAMGVDGFRFDLASVLGRDERGFNARATFFQIVAQDPVLAACKFIAEPWDLGPGGYQLGNYPARWSEWNDRYRDSVRRFWRADPGELPELARRLHGSGDLFEQSGRPPYSSINFITSHDGFTLRDLVSYKKRHNEANLEKNRDGHSSNLSCNHGHEGDTKDPMVERKRWQQQRNFLATLAVSQGVPMLLAGDEIGRTQRGNNNAYCQDNAINWLDWQGLDEQHHQLKDFVARLFSIRRHFSVLQADQYRHLPNDPNPDSIQWLNNDGEAMLESNWHERNSHSLGYLLTENKQQGDRYLLVVFNGSNHHQEFKLPTKPQTSWWQLVDTAIDLQHDLGVDAVQQPNLQLQANSLQILSSEAISEITLN